ncbi:hypothetical protein LEM8419_02482 [Neolewinella maritima]|uniref:DUF805 domain-containing protein n=1 Tax=Neolewinella maritima TaxID=1383882 RepID=A0ABN8F4Q0_9BACT|nr:hypothetical protein [Neolewinella maritima]CAH1001579.1 hypothetical protein LEM8419_02482 [Neolewinella maritima]
MTLPRPLNQAFGAYYEGLTRYADFSGTTIGRAYLSFLIVNLSITLLLAFLEYLTADGFFRLIGLLYGLVLLLPGLAITTRLLRHLSTR